MNTLTNTFAGTGLLRLLGRAVFAVLKFAFRVAFGALKLFSVLLLFVVVGQLARGPVD